MTGRIKSDGIYRSGEKNRRNALGRYYEKTGRKMPEVKPIPNKYPHITAALAAIKKREEQLRENSERRRT